MKQRKHIRMTILGAQVGLVLLVGLFVALGLQGLLSTTLVRATPGWEPRQLRVSEDGAGDAAAQPPNALVYNRNLFNQNAEPEEAPPAPAAEGLDEAGLEADAVDASPVLVGQPGQPVASDLAVQLLGTMVSAEQAGSIAHLRTPQNEDLYLRVGGRMPGAQVVTIAREYVLIRRDERPQGPLEYLTLYGRAPGAGVRVASAPPPMRAPIQASSPVVPSVPPVPATQVPDRALATVDPDAITHEEDGLFSIDRELLTEQNRLSGDLAETLQVQPLGEGGEVRGMRLGAVPQGSLFETVGLREGDVIVGVDGVEALDEATATRFLQQLEVEGEVTLEIDRRGTLEKVTLRAR